MIQWLYIILSSLHHVSEIAILSNSFFMFRNSRNFSIFLFKLLILTRNKFSRNFSTLHGISSKRKYGESTTSNLLLKKLMSRSLLSLFKICWKTKGLKTFSWEFHLEDLRDNIQDSFTDRFDFIEKFQKKRTVFCISFSLQLYHRPR